KIIRWNMPISKATFRLDSMGPAPSWSGIEDSGFPTETHRRPIRKDTLNLDWRDKNCRDAGPWCGWAERAIGKETTGCSSRKGMKPPVKQRPSIQRPHCQTARKVE